MNIVKKFTPNQVLQLNFAVDRFGYSLIHLCAHFNQLEILKFLVDHFRMSVR